MKIAHYIDEDVYEQNDDIILNQWRSFPHWVLHAAILCGIVALALAAVAAV
jgi:hypothetical protein